MVARVKHVNREQTFALTSLRELNVVTVYANCKCLLLHMSIYKVVELMFLKKT